METRDSYYAKTLGGAGMNNPAWNDGEFYPNDRDDGIVDDPQDTGTRR